MRPREQNGSGYTDLQQPLTKANLEASTVVTVAGVVLPSAQEQAERNEQEKLERKVKRAERAYLKANLEYCGINLLHAGAYVLLFGGSAALIYGTVAAGKVAAADNHSVPDKIGVNPQYDQHGNWLSFAASTHCGSVAAGYINPAFTSAIKLIGIYNQMIMNVLLFACGINPTVTVDGKRVTAPENGICANYQQAKVGELSTNDGALQAAFGLLQKLIDGPIAHLECVNADAFGGYVTLALFSAIAAAALLVLGIIYCRSECIHGDSFKAEAPDKERIVDQYANDDDSDDKSSIRSMITRRQQQTPPGSSAQTPRGNYGTLQLQ